MKADAQSCPHALADWASIGLRAGIALGVAAKKGSFARLRLRRGIGQPDFGRILQWLADFFDPANQVNIRRNG